MIQYGSFQSVYGKYIALGKKGYLHNIFHISHANYNIFHISHANYNIFHMSHVNHNIFFTFFNENILWVLIRSASMRHF